MTEDWNPGETFNRALEYQRPGDTEIPVDVICRIYRDRGLECDICE